MAMHHPFLIGELVYLRAFERGDMTDRYFQWFNDGEVTRFMSNGAIPNRQVDVEAFFDRMSRSPNDFVFAIVDRTTETHIGNTAIHNLDWIRRLGEFGIIVGEKEYWRKGYGTEATRLIVGFAFDRLNLNRVWLGVHADHKAAVRAYEKVGFRIEGRLRQEMCRFGTYGDRLIMGILRDEYYALHPPDVPGGPDQPSGPESHGAKTPKPGDAT